MNRLQQVDGFLEFMRRNSDRYCEQISELFNHVLSPC